MTDVDDLEHRIRTEWAKLDHAVIVAVVHQWRRRLSDISTASKPVAVISSTVFDFDIVFAAITATVLAVVDKSNSCTLIGRFCLTAVVFTVMTLGFAIHGDCLIRKVKQRH